MHNVLLSKRVPHLREAKVGWSGTNFREQKLGLAPRTWGPRVEKGSHA